MRSDSGFPRPVEEGPATYLGVSGQLDDDDSTWLDEPSISREGSWLGSAPTLALTAEPQLWTLVRFTPKASGKAVALRGAAAIVGMGEVAPMLLDVAPGGAEVGVAAAVTENTAAGVAAAEAAAAETAAAAEAGAVAADAGAVAADATAAGDAAAAAETADAGATGAEAAGIVDAADAAGAADAVDVGGSGVADLLAWAPGAGVLGITFRLLVWLAVVGSFVFLGKMLFR